MKKTGCDRQKAEIIRLRGPFPEDDETEDTFQADDCMEDDVWNEPEAESVSDIGFQTSR